MIAASDTVAAINGNVEKKLAVWGPQLKENGPQTLADVVFPRRLSTTRKLIVDGETIEIVDAEGLASRRYLFVPSLNAVLGGVMIFAGDMSGPPIHRPRNSALRRIISISIRLPARKPVIVVLDHMTTDAPTDLSGVAHTKAYLVAFEEKETESPGPGLQ